MKKEYSSVKSDGIELEDELKSMLGDITEEFDVLMNSFENSPIKNVENIENSESDEQLDMDECDRLISDNENPHNIFDE